MHRHRQMPNGDLVFRSVKDMPAEIAGYKQDKRELTIWHPAPGPCKYRVATTCELPCGKVRAQWTCAYFEKQVTLDMCLECLVSDKEPDP